jgi:hypothetical protein
MKKILLLTLISIFLASCSGLDSIKVTESEYKIIAQRIIDMGLSHDKSINEANKILEPVLASQVVTELDKRKIEADNALIEAQLVADYVDKIVVLGANSDDQIIITGSTLSKSRTLGLLDKADQQNFYLSGIKDNNSGLIKHKLNLSIQYTSDEWRAYKTATFCDKWQGCSDGEKIDIIVTSKSAGNCSGFKCDYTEKMELELSSDFLATNSNLGFAVNFTSDKISNKITIPSAYLKAYIQLNE